MSKSFFLLLLSTLIVFPSQAQSVYQNLQTGEYEVGFKIVTIEDDTRYEPQGHEYPSSNQKLKPREMSIHIWYPAQVTSKNRTITYGEYCYNHLQSSTAESMDSARIQPQLRSRKRTVRSYFGEPDEKGWAKLIAAPLLAYIDAEPMNGSFPLLMGSLRPLSTSIVNEYMASHGYIVAMIEYPNFNGTFGDMALDDVRDMQLGMTWMVKNMSVDPGKIGSYGFSGAGFSQVLLAMSEPRIKAIADLESGLFMDRLFQSLSASNYYKPERLRVPFLHIFSTDLSQEEIHLSQFEEEMKFSTRYRLTLNQPALHHWDFASEGYTACLFLNNRGEEKRKIEQSFELSCKYLVKFFDVYLKQDQQALAFLQKKPTIQGYASELWDLTTQKAVQPAPNLDQFEQLITKKGIEEAVSIARNTIMTDSTSNLWEGSRMNAMGYRYLAGKQYDEAISIFKLNAELHPTAAGWIDSLAEAYELFGNKAKMKQIAKHVVDILTSKETLSDSDQSLLALNQERLAQ
ncbi:MAG: CocE/NonD family hydrolase [Reichenbachiella sp.]|uniref:CocE/NonD family hydrolase n=1 Tax=Reichenbachiella sp. TaxID=2184521 RepID=UPI003267AD8E